VIVLDGTTLSDEVQEILKSATTSIREPIEYRTVTRERRVRVCTIPERCVWWVAKAEGSGDDQFLNRMITCWIDGSRNIQCLNSPACRSTPSLIVWAENEVVLH